MLWGDHGYSLGEAGHWCKDTNFELDTHVPLIVRTPRMAQPGVGTDALTELVDIYPTLAELSADALIFQAMDHARPIEARPPVVPVLGVRQVRLRSDQLVREWHRGVVGR